MHHFQSHLGSSWLYIPRNIPIIIPVCRPPLFNNHGFHDIVLPTIRPEVIPTHPGSSWDDPSLGPLLSMPARISWRPRNGYGTTFKRISQPTDRAEFGIIFVEYPLQKAFYFFIDLQ